MATINNKIIQSSAVYNPEDFIEIDEKQQKQQHQQEHQKQQQQQELANQFLQEIHAQQHVHQLRKPQTRTRRSPKTFASPYSAWARSQAMASVYILLIGGILCIFFPKWLSGTYSINNSTASHSVLSFMVYFVEKKPSHNQSEKISTGGGVGGIANGTPSLPPISISPASVLKAHSIRSVFYIIASVPCFLCVPNYTGGMCLISSGITYAVAAIFARQKVKKNKGKVPLKCSFKSSIEKQ
ncbi:hypothetical protein FBU30_000363 [Linnemannia zychae]|nr:hypothetical protein FBU30_000363 [Linnemannia zychae]